ncbi:unnamed protein product, partial [Aphanomyces euteiches]
MSAKPLPPNFFHCPPLSRDEKQRFKEQGIAAAYELAENTQLKGGPIKWELDSNEHDLKIYMGKVAGTKYAAFSATPCLSTIEIMGTMTEVFDLFRSQTTEEAKDYCRRFGKVLEDAVNLYSIVPVTPETPHEMVGISWRGFKPSVDKLVMRRDACLLDVHHAFEFNGKHVWVRCLKSVALSCCPQLPGYVRMTHHCSGHIFSESDKPGYIDVSFIVHADAGGSVGDYASWIVDMTSRKRCRNLTDIDRFLRENRMSKTPFLKADKTKPVTLASSCYLCTRRFGPLSKKTNCLTCGEVCCRRCIRLWDVKNRGFDAQASVCTKCALGKPDNQKPSVWWRTSQSYTDESHFGSDGHTTPGSQGSTTSSPKRLDLFELAVDARVWSSKKQLQ